MRTLALTALNLAVCWRLFKVEYTDHFSSIEGSFIAIARYLSRHWGDSSWWPLWHCGTPYQDTYLPLLHMAVAAAATIGHISAARAYHGVAGAAYAMGAVTLYWMALRLGAPRGAAFLSALFYSLLSPSALLMPATARDIGGMWYSRRLQVLTVYGEGPHVSAMTLLPVAILALDYALAQRTRRAFALAALPIALVFLTNVPGTMALGLAVFCWICAQPKGRFARAWAVAASASVLAYGLACYGAPPSSLRTVFANVGATEAGFSHSLKHGPILLALVLAAVAATGYLLSRSGVPLVVQFAALYFGLTAALVLTANESTFELLPQAGRLHLEMEMAACLLLGSAGWAAYAWMPRRVAYVALALCLVLLVIQFQHYRFRARFDTQHADLAKRSEYTTARWLDANMNGGRVYAAGSTAFWLNAFTETPQLLGCCDQGLSMPVLTYVPYLVNSAAGPRDTEIARTWLQALGVQAIVVNGAESTDVYKDIQAPQRFGRIFTALHEENGDTVYSVPTSASLAHTLRPGEQVPIRPSVRVETSDVARYAAAIGNNSRAPASMQWLRAGEARIRTSLRRDDLVSVQVAWLRGWQAFARGERKRVSADGLGFLVIAPECEGDCEIALKWTGPPDLTFSEVVSSASLALVLALLAARAGRPVPDKLGVQ